MKAGTIQILDLDFEFKLWKNRLYYYQSELEIMLGRIFVLHREHPAYKIPDEKKELIEKQQQTVRHILNEIENMEQEMSLYAEDYPISENHQHYAVHEQIRKGMDSLAAKQAEIMCYLFPDLCYPKVTR